VDVAIAHVECECVLGVEHLHTDVEEALARSQACDIDYGPIDDPILDVLSPMIMAFSRYDCWPNIFPPSRHPSFGIEGIDHKALRAPLCLPIARYHHRLDSVGSWHKRPFENEILDLCHS